MKTIGNDKVVQAHQINDMSVNPVYGSVATAGGNGAYTIWDIGQKSRIHWFSVEIGDGSYMDTLALYIT